MNNLLKVIYSKENAKAALKICEKKGFLICHRRYGMALTEDLIERDGAAIKWGRYGSRFSLNLGKSFSESWGFAKKRKIKDTVYATSGSIVWWDELPLTSTVGTKGKPFDNLKVYFCENKPDTDSNEVFEWIAPLNEVMEDIVAKGGSIAKKPTSANLVVVLSESVILDLPDNVLKVSQEHFPFPIKVSHAVTNAASTAWNLLASKETASIDRGLAILSETPTAIDELIEGCSVDADGQLARSNRFSGSRQVAEYLDWILLEILSLAVPGSEAARLRARIRSLRINVRSLPLIHGFELLENLELRCSAASGQMRPYRFGAMPNLKTLSIDDYWESTVGITTLDGLIAPNLQTLKISAPVLEDISALGDCRSLVKVEIFSRNLRGTDCLLASRQTLKYCHLVGLQLSDVKNLLNLDRLEYFDFTGH